ncbi:sugar ABC transporter ATP-binding protein [Labrys monachus]|uniref:Rhamnose transport system ATP-binding protein n=1 Tax=Labrys monachus TaxID=217067 RepID=A0ABU0FGB8_9HYPH|nr:sugar ABC transporter ATP-binding protein [Labrys monachus]MDQ0393576.1 rhamnose transport system ATP-binding protein [Labrys monachus]
MTNTPGPPQLTPQRAAGVPSLALTGVSKSFPGVRALDAVSLSLYPGEVTALIGENGAGKSTLVKIMTGIYQPSAGTISVDGRPVIFSSAQDAFRAGITAIHQETVLFDDLSVAENIFLGHAPRGRFGTINWRSVRRQARDVLGRMGAGHIDPGARLKDLGIASRHLVAVARALSIDARIVIMDEPTAALSLREIEELFTLIDLLKRSGKAILFISHKFDEIYRIADRFTVFRDGAMVGEGLIRDTGQDEIVRLMVGRSVDHIFPRREPRLGAPVLAVSGLSHPTEFEDIGFELRKGEILGFYGLIGAGRSEVMQAIAGMTRTSRGAITLEGRALAPRSAADSIEAGIVYVPEDRGRQGVVIGLPIFQNISLPSLGRTSKSGLLRLAEEFALARAYTERLDLRASSLSQDVGTLSGGNQQKVVIAKWLATAPKVIILDEPTKGIDIGSKAAVHGFMAELVAQGLSVIMVSSELPEILGMSDRVAVMREGRLAAIYDRRGLDAETLVRSAAGIVP